MREDAAGCFGTQEFPAGLASKAPTLSQTTVVRGIVGALLAGARVLFRHAGIPACTLILGPCVVPAV